MIKFNIEFQQHISLSLHTAYYEVTQSPQVWWSVNLRREGYILERYSIVYHYVTRANMFLHGSGIFSMYLREANSQEHNSGQEYLLNASDPPVSPTAESEAATEDNATPDLLTDIEAESEAATEANVTTDILAESETASEIATAIINAMVESVHVISGGIPLLSDKNPAEQIEVSTEVAEIIQSVFRGKADLVTTDRRLSTRVKHSPKPRAIYASEDDINSAIGPLGSSDLGSWRKLKKPKVTFSQKS